MPAQPPFAEPFRLFLTKFYLEELHGPVHDQNGRLCVF